MTKSRVILGWLAFLLAGSMVLLKALGNPRLRELRVPDALLLIAVGIFVGVGVAQLPRFVHKD
jgi:hypothetical protein